MYPFDTFMRVIILPLLDNYLLTYWPYLIYKNCRELTRKSVRIEELRAISFLVSTLLGMSHSWYLFYEKFDDKHSVWSLLRKGHRMEQER